MAIKIQGKAKTSQEILCSSKYVLFDLDKIAIAIIIIVWGAMNFR